MTSAAILGFGVVGKATAHVFGIKKYFDLKGSNVTLKEVADCKYVFICLPSPLSAHSRYKIQDIEDIVVQVKNYGRQNIFIIRSTVHPGFANSLMNKLRIKSIISNPEFLTSSTWKRDAENPDIIVVGGVQQNYLESVVGVYRARFKGVDIFKTDNITAELAKWTVNGFYATKVVYANQVYDFASRIKANYNQIKKIMYARKWIGKNHLDVFHGETRGVGGKCLKKDLEVFAELSQLPLLIQVRGMNNGYLLQKNR